MPQEPLEPQTPRADPDNVRGIDQLLEVMSRLRDPSTGCPWDLAQKAETIVPHTIEEAYEVAEAIEDGDVAAQLDELGDLLFQVVFYAQLAREDDRFDFDMIASSHARKMISRHPHVFGHLNNELSPDVSTIWEERKAVERAKKAEREGKVRQSVLDGIGIGLPAATRSVKLQKRAARVGFDWPDLDPVVEKLEEEINEIKELLELPDFNIEGQSEPLEDEIGDVIFAAINVARHLQIDPEKALRRANRKFERRFHKIEQEFENKEKKLTDASLDELEDAWVRAKMQERT